MFRAGFAKIQLPVPDGVAMMGYANREGGVSGVDEPLHARAMVLEADGVRVALCTVDLCWVTESVVDLARRRIAARGLIDAPAILISATHTHSGPSDTDPVVWPEGLDSYLEEVIAEACDRLVPARLGAGWGMVNGISTNRVRLEEPADPAVFVIRVDRAEDSRPLGVYYSFACHPVVLGPDSTLVSGDWPAICARLVETELGHDAIAVYAQGAAGDVNPLTPAVRAALGAAGAVLANIDQFYYGDSEPRFDIGDRRGGTRDEAQAIAEAVTAETLHVHRGITTTVPTGLWTDQLLIQSHVTDDDATSPPADHIAWIWNRPVPTEPMEIMLVGIDGPGVVLIGEPGEPFSSTGVDLRRTLRAAGIPHPYLVGYANGYRSYLPPPYAFADGGYEADWAHWYRHKPTLQDQIRAAVTARLISERSPDHHSTTPLHAPR
jgi:hypothetical protein